MKYGYIIDIDTFNEYVEGELPDAIVDLWGEHYYYSQGYFYKTKATVLSDARKINRVYPETSIYLGITLTIEDEVERMEKDWLVLDDDEDFEVFTEDMFVEATDDIKNVDVVV